VPSLSRSLLIWCFLPWPVAAQDVRERLAAAAADADAGRFDVALASALSLQSAVTGTAEREALARLFLTVGNALADRAALDDALRAHEAGLRLRRALHGTADHPATAECLRAVGYTLFRLGDANAAEPLLRELVAMEQKLRPESREVQRAHEALATCLRALGRWSEALANYESAMAIDRPGNDGASAARFVALLERSGDCLRALGRPADALERFDRALLGLRSFDGDEADAMRAKLEEQATLAMSSLGRMQDARTRIGNAVAMRRRLAAGRDDAGLARCLSSEAACIGELGDFAGALRGHQEALAMQRRLWGAADHRNVAASLYGIGLCLEELGDSRRALEQAEAALAMRRRLFGERDHPDVARSLELVAGCHSSLGDPATAVPAYRDALAMWLRLRPGGDADDVSWCRNNLAEALDASGDTAAAASLLEENLASLRRQHGDADHPLAAGCLANLAHCLGNLAQFDRAKELSEAALAMWRRLHQDHDHPAVARSLANFAACAMECGDTRSAKDHYGTALAMWERLNGGRDHPDQALCRNNLGMCHAYLGEEDAALARYEQAVAEWRRLFGAVDHPQIATALNNIGTTLWNSGDTRSALAALREAVAMEQRLRAGQDHPSVAGALHNLGMMLQGIDNREAVAMVRAALAMWRRLHPDLDHPGVASSLAAVATLQWHARQHDLALAGFEAALAMRQRIFAGRDHPDVTYDLLHCGQVLAEQGRFTEAQAKVELALAMWERLCGTADHPHAAALAAELARTLFGLGKIDAARSTCERACAMMERLRAESRTTPEMRGIGFDRLKDSGAFELLQTLTAASAPANALEACERSRARTLLDLLEDGRLDPLDEALRHAQSTADAAAAERLRRLGAELQQARLECDLLLQRLVRLADAPLSAAEATHRRRELVAGSDAATTRLRRLLAERARQVADVLPTGQVRSAAEIQGALRPGEILLEFTVTDEHAWLYVVSPHGAIEAIARPAAAAAVTRCIPAILRRVSREQVGTVRGRDPEPNRAAAPAGTEPRELFDALIPDGLWPRIRAARRVFVAAHGELHRLPFELLAIATGDDRTQPWIEVGPPISYVPSGSALVWLRERDPTSRAATTTVDLLAVGDPSARLPAPLPPEQGAMVLTVDPGGEGARVGVLPGDVITHYADVAVVDDRSLNDVERRVTGSTDSAATPAAALVIELWRDGALRRLECRPDRLGVELAAGNARSARLRSLAGTDATPRRSGDIERLSLLPPLRGAQAEVQAVADLFIQDGAIARRLLHAQATESGVFELAPGAKYLHFACHGVADVFAGRAFSMLVLGQPSEVTSRDDGLLKLDDLLDHWRGRLDSCRLVVLSACRTNVGPLQRDDPPHALPIGFLCAGAASVACSLWSVDDDSTRVLMTDFYRRLLAGETDRLLAFTEARKAVRASFPDPFHWAPFQFVGCPD